jgi:hypothetical protein
MRKSGILSVLLMLLVFQYCSTAKKAQTAPMVTYQANVQPVIQANCAPCHIGPGGKQSALNNYSTAKMAIDDIVSRIQKNPTDRGFMPFKHPKLPDSTIQVFVRWKNDGLLEK